eukprot:m.31064 g.31064  ORF g.31064 m.31064 type:complete len:75 (-) comp14681_c0_seq1:42-266(-)
MSARAKLALGGSCLLTAAIIAGVHYSQTRDQENLHQGVIKDIERQERKRKNQQQFEQQKALRTQMEQEEGKNPS